MKHLMKKPSVAETYVARQYQDTVHPNVAISTHVAFMGIVRDWLEEIDPFVKWQDYTRQDFMDVMGDLLDLYEEKKND